jgi:hypothetical protein
VCALVVREAPRERDAAHHDEDHRGRGYGIELLLTPLETNMVTGPDPCGFRRRLPAYHVVEPRLVEQTQRQLAGESGTVLSREKLNPNQTENNCCCPASSCSWGDPPIQGPNRCRSAAKPFCPQDELLRALRRSLILPLCRGRNHHCPDQWAVHVSLPINLVPSCRTPDRRTTTLQRVASALQRVVPGTKRRASPAPRCRRSAVLWRIGGMTTRGDGSGNPRGSFESGYR